MNRGLKSMMNLEPRPSTYTSSRISTEKGLSNIESKVQELCIPKATKNYKEKNGSSSIFDSYKNKCKKIEEIHLLTKSIICNNAPRKLPGSGSNLRPLSSIVDFTGVVPVPKKRGHKRRRRKLSPAGKSIEVCIPENNSELDNIEPSSSSSTENLDVEVEPIDILDSVCELTDLPNFSEDTNYQEVSTSNDETNDDESVANSDDDEEVDETKLKLLEELKEIQCEPNLDELLLFRMDEKLSVLDEAPFHHQPVDANLNEIEVKPCRCRNCDFQMSKLKKQNKKIDKLELETLAVKEKINKKNLKIDGLTDQCQILIREYTRLTEQNKLLKLKDQLIHDEIEKSKYAISQAQDQLQLDETSEVVAEKTLELEREEKVRPPTAEQYITLLQTESKAHKLEQDLRALVSDKSEMTELLNNILHTLHIKGYESIHNTNTGKHVKLHSKIPGKLLELKGRDIIRLKSTNGPSNYARKLQIQDTFLKNVIGVKEHTIQELSNAIMQNEKIDKKKSKAKVIAKKFSKSKSSSRGSSSSSTNSISNIKKSIISPKDGSGKIEKELMKFANCLEEICFRHPKTVDALIGAQNASRTKYPVVDAVVSSIKSQATSAKNKSTASAKKSNRSLLGLGQAKQQASSVIKEGSIYEKNERLQVPCSISKKKFSFSGLMDVNCYEPGLINDLRGKMTDIIPKAKRIGFVKHLALPGLK